MNLTDERRRDQAHGIAVVGLLLALTALGAWAIPKQDLTVTLGAIVVVAVFGVTTASWERRRRAVRRNAAHSVCEECSAITGIQQECDWLCSGSS